MATALVPGRPREELPRQKTAAAFGQMPVVPRRGFPSTQYLCHTDIGMPKKDLAIDSDTARNRLIEAEEEYQSARVDDYVSRLVRDSAIVDAHRAGLSSGEISKLVGDIGQPNVVRARRRAVTRREVVPKGLLSPADAVRESGLGPRDFILAVRERRIVPVELPGAVRAFRVEDVHTLQSAS